MNAHAFPYRIPTDNEPDALDDAADERAAEALARFRAQWPPERCLRLGRMVDGDYSQVWAEALAPKETDTPADEALRSLSDEGLRALSKGQRRYVREMGK